MAYSKYKQLVYENVYENGFVNVDLNENVESAGGGSGCSGGGGSLGCSGGGGGSLGGESGCVTATPCSTPGSARSDEAEAKKWRKHSETEI